MTLENHVFSAASLFPLTMFVVLIRQPESDFQLSWLQMKSTQQNE